MTPTAKTIRVHLAERSHDIEIGVGNLAAAGRFLVERAKTTRVVLITDDHVQRPHAMAVAESLGDEDIDADVICIEPGEESKSLDVAAALWQGLLDLEADRDTVVAAVGGGVVGDLAGFVAATFARGLRFLQVPTSLLAQVDSSLGGKVGINLPGVKNIVGAFHQPLGVLIDIAALTTLPDAEFRNGLAEVVKYGAALDADLFQFLEANATSVLERRQDAMLRVVERCCRLKAGIVERDEREQTGERAVLNFGHTFAHAFEMAAVEDEEASLRLPHGEAVAVGMTCAARLAERMHRVDAAFTARLGSLLKTFGLPTCVPSLDRRRILDAMTHDKKSSGGRLRFVLPSKLGHAELTADVEPQEILAAMEE